MADASAINASATHTPSNQVPLRSIRPDGLPPTIPLRDNEPDTSILKQKKELKQSVLEDRHNIILKQQDEIRALRQKHKAEFEALHHKHKSETSDIDKNLKIILQETRELKKILIEEKRWKDSELAQLLDKYPTSTEKSDGPFTVLRLIVSDLSVDKRRKAIEQFGWLFPICRGYNINHYYERHYTNIIQFTTDEMAIFRRFRVKVYTVEIRQRGDIYRPHYRMVPWVKRDQSQ